MPGRTLTRTPGRMRPLLITDRDWGWKGSSVSAWQMDCDVGIVADCGAMRGHVHDSLYHITWPDIQSLSACSNWQSFAEAEKKVHVRCTLDIPVALINIALCADGTKSFYISLSPAKPVSPLMTSWISLLIVQSNSIWACSHKATSLQEGQLARASSSLAPGRGCNGYVCDQESTWVNSG